MKRFEATLAWQRGDQAFTDLRYSRAHRWHFFLLLLMAQAHRWLELFEDASVAPPPRPVLTRSAA